MPNSPCFVFTIGNKKILFSGDLCSGDSRFNCEDDIPGKVDLIFEGGVIYAKHRHKIGMEQRELFRNDLEKAFAAGKTAWMPALSFNRTQKILYGLKLEDYCSLSKKISVYSISSSANDITTLYKKG